MIRSVLRAFLLLLFSLCCIKANAGVIKPSKPYLVKAVKKIVFIAGKPSHGPGEHEMYAGCMLLADELKKSMPGAFETVIYRGSWPTEADAFDDAAALVLYVDGGPGNIVLPHLEQVDALMKKGVGLACLHYAVEVPKGAGGDSYLNWIGGYFEINWSVNPTWLADYQSFPKHDVTRGVSPFAIKDEWYYHMRFRDGMQGVTPLLVAIPPASALSRKDGPHENNEFVRAEAGKPQTMAWAAERPDGGRGFGFTGGHYHHNWIDGNIRKLVLNGIAWVAKAKIPRNGLASPTPTEDELKLNLDAKGKK